MSELRGKPRATEDRRRWSLGEGKAAAGVTPAAGGGGRRSARGGAILSAVATLTLSSSSSISPAGSTFSKGGTTIVSFGKLTMVIGDCKIALPSVHCIRHENQTTNFCFDSMQKIFQQQSCRSTCQREINGL
jgi:hypothetical protein